MKKTTSKSVDPFESYDATDIHTHSDTNVPTYKTAPVASGVTKKKPKHRERNNY